MASHNPNRRQQILETLALQLESNPGSRITTAGLASAVGVSEAALYRHFASKAKMFEALIDFAEESVFGLINNILAQDKDVVTRCDKIMRVVLGFSDKNPGITRILLGDALVGENDRLRVRVNRFFQRLETQFKQILREANLGHGMRATATIDATANQLLILLEGKMGAYVRSEFAINPTDYWQDQWELLQKSLFKQG